MANDALCEIVTHLQTIGLLKQQLSIHKNKRMASFSQKPNKIPALLFGASIQMTTRFILSPIDI